MKLPLESDLTPSKSSSYKFNFLIKFVDLIASRFWTIILIAFLTGVIVLLTMVYFSPSIYDLEFPKFKENFKNEENRFVNSHKLINKNYRSLKLKKTWTWLDKNQIDFSILADSKKLKTLIQNKNNFAFLTSTNQANQKNYLGYDILVREQRKLLQKYYLHNYKVYTEDQDIENALMLKDIYQVERRIRLVLEKLVKEKKLFDEEEDNVYKELKKIVPLPSSYKKILY